MSASIVQQAQQAYLAQHAAGRTREMTDAARAADTASHKELNAMRAKPCNAECFDCTAKKPGWAALPHGVFVCIDCAQMHRNMGRHVTQTKAINTGTYLWFPHEIAVMRAVGNGVAARAYSSAPPKPDRDAPQAEKEAYCRAKYEERRWGPNFAAAPEPQPQPQPAAAVTATSLLKPTAKPLQPISSAVQPRKAVGLAAAKHVPLETSLIDLGEPPHVPAPQAPAAPTGAQGWAAFEDDWPSTFTAAQPQPTQAAQPVQPTDQQRYDDKKAAVLSLYAAAPPHFAPPAFGWSPHSQVPQQPVPVGGGSDFFARYGL